MKLSSYSAIWLLPLICVDGFNTPKLSSSCTPTRIVRKNLPLCSPLVEVSEYAKLRMSTAVTTSEDAVLPLQEDIVVNGDSKAQMEEKIGVSRSTKMFVGTSFFFVVDYILRKLFQAKGIAFPSMMAGCVMIFLSLVGMEMSKEGLGNKVFDFLTPSSDVLVKWLPVFFVPGLAMLPLAPKIGSAMDVFKVFCMIPLGFLFTLLSTAYSVLGVRYFQGKLKKTEEVTGIPEVIEQTKVTTKRVKPYSVNKCRNLLLGSLGFGALSMILVNTGLQSNILYTPIMTAFMLCTTLGAFLFGGNLPPKFTSIIHPIATATSYTWLLTALFASMTGSNFASLLQTYRVGSYNLLNAGAGDMLLYMLGPGVCSLSISMYSRKKLMKENLAAVLVGVLVSSAGGILSSALYVRLFDVPGAVLRLSLITRNVTTALAMALTTILGGNTSIIASLLVTTGVFGSTIARKLMSALKLKDPVSRGLGVGAAAQGIGVASLQQEKDSLPFAAINMILTALCSSVLISIPVVREFVKKVALGGLA